MTITPAGPTRDWGGDLLLAIVGIAIPVLLTVAGVPVWTVLGSALVLFTALAWWRFSLSVIWGGLALLLALILLSVALLHQAPWLQVSYQICYEPDWVPVPGGYVLDGMTVGVRVINEGRRFWASSPEVEVVFDDQAQLPGLRSDPQPIDHDGNDLLASGTVDLPRPIAGNGPVGGSFRIEVPYGPSRENADTERLIVSGTYVARVTQTLKRVAFEYSLDPETNREGLITKPCRLSYLTM